MTRATGENVDDLGNAGTLLRLGAAFNRGSEAGSTNPDFMVRFHDASARDPSEHLRLHAGAARSLRRFILGLLVQPRLEVPEAVLP
jgi:hypothetical protein